MNSVVQSKHLALGSRQPATNLLEKTARLVPLGRILAPSSHALGQDDKPHALALAGLATDSRLLLAQLVEAPDRGRAARGEVGSAARAERAVRARDEAPADEGPTRTVDDTAEPA